MPPPSLPFSSSLSLVHPPPPPPPPGFPPLSLPLSSPYASASSLGFVSSSASVSTAFPRPSVSSSSSSSSSVPLSSSASSSVSGFSLWLAEFHVRYLGLSSEFIELAKWFVSSAVGVNFFDFVSSSFPHLVPDLARDCASGSSQLLSALRSSFPPAATSASSSAPSVPPFATRFPISSLPAPSRFPAPHPPPILPFSARPTSSSSSSLAPQPSAPLPQAGSSLSYPPPPFPPLTTSYFPGGGSAVVQGLGAGVPLPPFSSGVPPFPPFVPHPTLSHSGLPLSGAPAAAPAYRAPAFDPHASASAPQFEDPPLDTDDRPFDDDVPFADPSAPSLSLDSLRSEYRRMAEYILGLFPQAVGVSPSAPPPLALFESFFAASALSPPTLHFNWFDHVCQSITDADARMASFLTSGCSDRAFLPSRHLSYAMRGEHSGAKAVPVNESLLAHFERPLRPNLLVGLSVRDAMNLGASFCGQSETLSYALWLLSGLLGFVRLQGFSPSDPALFNQLVTALSKSLAHQASVTASQISYICAKRREFYLSHLPAYFTDSTKLSCWSPRLSLRMRSLPSPM